VNETGGLRKDTLMAATNLHYSLADVIYGATEVDLLSVVLVKFDLAPLISCVVRHLNSLKMRTPLLTACYTFILVTFHLSKLSTAQPNLE
jgi:hypothetical protein